MNKLLLPATVTLLSSALVGCAHTGDVELQHPLVAGSVSQNKIARAHGMDEQRRGLPPGSLTDEVRLTTMNDAKVCFAYSMHELTPVDNTAVTASLKAPKVSKLERPIITGLPSTPKTYDGLVPRRERTGTETVCVSRDRYDICQRWETRPTYVTRMVPGPVTVYEAKGNVCFAHDGALTPQTDQLKLDLKVPTQGAPQLTPVSNNGGYNPFAGFANGFGAVQATRGEFSWLLLGATKKE